MTWRVDAIYNKATRSLWYIEIEIDGVVNKFFSALDLRLWWDSVWYGKPYNDKLRFQMTVFNPLNYLHYFN